MYNTLVTNADRMENATITTKVILTSITCVL